MHKVDTVVLHSLLQSGHDIYIASDYGTDPITGQHIGNRQPMFTNSAAKLMRETPKKSQLDFHMTESERKEWAVPQLQRKTKELEPFRIKLTLMSTMFDGSKKLLVRGTGRRKRLD